MKKNNSFVNEKGATNKIWIVLLIALLGFIYFTPKEIAYPDNKNVVWVLYVSIFSILPYLVFKIIKSTNPNTSPIKRSGICALSMLIVGPTSIMLHDYQEEKELKLNGMVTNSFVVDKKWTSGEWLINCNYFVNNTEFTTYYYTDEKDKYSIGDTVKLIYNKEFPRMYKIELE